MKMRWWVWIIVLIVSYGHPVIADEPESSGEDKWKWETRFSPGMAENDGSWAGSVDFRIAGGKNIYMEAKYKDKEKKELTEFRKKFDAYVTTEGSILTDADLNTKPIKAEAKFAYVINLYKARKVAKGREPKTYEVISKGFDLGRSDFSVAAGYETDQKLDNRNYTLASEAALVQTKHGGIRGLIPSVYLGYDLLKIDASQTQDEQGLDDDSAERFRAFAQWKVEIGSWISEDLDPLDLHIDLRYYKTEGLPDAQNNVGEDKATYVAAMLTYSFTGREPFGIINAVFLRVDNGRVPPVTEDASSVTFGITMFEK